ncbi:MAG: twin-arginine translocation signal domain-containing protein [Chloroflexota bacterium]
MTLQEQPERGRGMSRRSFLSRAALGVAGAAAVVAWRGNSPWSALLSKGKAKHPADQSYAPGSMFKPRDSKR